MTFDLVVRGGTVVTPDGVRSADVGVAGGRIAAIEDDLGERGMAAGTVVDAHGLLVLPGAVDAHTHTRVATDDEPDRFFRDSVAAAFGGTTTFLAFNNPGTGASAAAERSFAVGMREWRASTRDDAAVDIGLSLVVSGRMDDPVRQLETIVDEGVPTAKAFMIFDFRLDDRRLFDAMAALGRRGGMLEVHCEDPVLVDAAVEAALRRGDVLPRYHAGTRPPYAEAVATARTVAFARATGAPVHVVHLSTRDALEAVRAAKAEGLPVSAETCPHYLTLTADRYDEPDPVRCACYVITPPLRSMADQDALWEGLADGTLDLVASDHVPDRADREKAEAARGVSFDRLSNGAPGIETLLTLLYDRGVARGRITLERMVQLVATEPARRFGLPRKGAVEVGRDADLVLFDPAARRTIRAADLHHTSDYTPYEGIDVRGAVRSVFVRGRAVVRDGIFVGQRGFGREAERAQIEG